MKCGLGLGVRVAQVVGLAPVMNCELRLSEGLFFRADHHVFF